MAEAIKLKLLSPAVKDGETKVVGVIFVNDVEKYLTEVRSQMITEVEELIPKSFKFVSKWGAPVSSYQEAKLSLNDVLDNGFLAIQAVPQGLDSELESHLFTSRSRSPSPSASQSLLEDKYESSSLINTASTLTSQDQTPNTEIGNQDLVNKCSAPKKIRKSMSLTQTTLTGYFGASTAPERKYTTAATRKGVHVYTEREINDSMGYEKERRKFWNTKAEEVCRLQCYNRCSADQIDKLLHEQWKIHKAYLLKQEDLDTTKKIQAIYEKYPNLESVVTSARKMKKDTVDRNLIRVDNAKEVLEKSRQTLDRLYGSLQDNFTLNIKKQIEAKEELHKCKYRELSKAEDALRQTLDIKKSLLRELLQRK